MSLKVQHDAGYVYLFHKQSITFVADTTTNLATYFSYCSILCVVSCCVMYVNIFNVLVFTDAICVTSVYNLYVLHPVAFECTKMYRLYPGINHKPAGIQYIKK
jgi:hypothetical protein